MQDVRSPNEPNDAPIGGAEVKTPDGRSLPLVSAKLRVDAGGGLARIVLEQTFENPYDDTLRVTYKMPLPALGAVSGYAFRIGQRTITGKVDRKESARERFEEAVAHGHTAALLEEENVDIFTQEIGNIPPRRMLVAEITIDQRLAWKPEGEWELRFPTVIGPRYLEANLSAEERRASHVELADAGGVRGRVHLEVRIADEITKGRRAESPSHSLRVGSDGVIELADLDGARLDRDIVVRWPVAKQEVGMAVQIARPSDGAHTRHAYALLSVVPPALAPHGERDREASSAAVPRDLIVLLDTSGSMDGPPLEQGKRVIAALIDSLSEQDRLEVVEFSMRPNRYTKSPVPGTKREKEKAIQWVMSRKASGGTEMQSAILDALKGLRPGAQRQVVLVTDGYVGGEQQIVTIMHESLPESCRLHVVGVGSAVNRALAASLARAGRGAEILVGLDEDAERFAKTLVDKTRAPVLTDVRIGGDALVQCAPEHLPDVFAGAPLLAALQVRASGGEIVVRGNLPRGSWEQRVVVPAIDPGDGNQAVVKLFARESVADLEMRWAIGNEVEAIDREIESLGLVFQISTRKTSWLAIDEERSVDPRLGSRHEEIPQEVPYGTTFASFGGAPVVPQQQEMGFGAPLASMAMSMGSLSLDEEDAFTMASPASYAMPAARPAPAQQHERGAPEAKQERPAGAPAGVARSLSAPAPVPGAGPMKAQARLARARSEPTLEASAPSRPMMVGRRANRWLVLLVAVLLALGLAALVVWLLIMR
jgi:Ca-activated chloride channel family protein